MNRVSKSRGAFIEAFICRQDVSHNGEGAMDGGGKYWLNDL